MTPEQRMLIEHECEKLQKLYGIYADQLDEREIRRAVRGRRLDQSAGAARLSRARGGERRDQSDAGAAASCTAM